MVIFVERILSERMDCAKTLCLHRLVTNFSGKRSCRSYLSTTTVERSSKRNRSEHRPASKRKPAKVVREFGLATEMPRWVPIFLAVGIDIVLDEARPAWNVSKCRWKDRSNNNNTQKKTCNLCEQCPRIEHVFLPFPLPGLYTQIPDVDPEQLSPHTIADPQIRRSTRKFTCLFYFVYLS